MRKILEKLKKDTQKLLNLTPKDKEKIILEIAANLRKNECEILKNNEKDLQNFTRDAALKDRLKLDKKRLENLCKSLEQIAILRDPVGRVIDGWVNYAGLEIKKVAVPLGVVAVIYEARPNISAELVCLLLKSANGGILKGGSEAKFTNSAIFAAVSEILAKYKLNSCFAMFSERKELDEMLKMDDLIDILVPRGSSEMIAKIAQKTKIPLIKHDKGLCHIFVDESANLSDAVKIIINAKCQRPSVCNALETLLVHENVAKALFATLMPNLIKEKVEIYADEVALKLLKAYKIKTHKATKREFSTEWLSLKLNLRLVKGVSEAIEHINAYGSGHSDSILSQNAQNITLFSRQVASACVYANASTRFSDGGEFGFGAEVGISTSKLHARGPMGVDDLCTYKYVIVGAGQARE